jgi:Winged helix DNA-binding domain
VTRVLDARTRNRIALARQLLLTRERASIPDVLDRMAGLQAQYAPSMYVGLWSRIAGFRRSDLTTALEDRTVVQGTLLRSTIHLVSAAAYWTYAIAVRSARRQWWLRVHPDIAEKDMVVAADRLAERLRDRGVIGAAELEEITGRVGGAPPWFELVRVPPSGTWERRRANLYAAAEDWLGPPPDLAEGDAVAAIARHYLRGFGPAAGREIANWAGVRPGSVTAALRELDLVRYRDEDGRELLDAPDGLMVDPDEPVPVRFLPTWDATLLAHARRTGILPEHHRGVVFHVRNPQSMSTFLVDGAVAGAWRVEDGRLALEPFEPLDDATVDALHAEGAGLVELYG